MADFMWAREQLELGNAVRRPGWEYDLYLKKDDEGDVMAYDNVWRGGRGHGFILEVDYTSLFASDWELTPPEEAA